MHVYMNHAATSAAKPKEMIDALAAYLAGNDQQSAGRGEELAAARVALDARINLAELFGAPSPSHVIFTSGATQSLNMAIHGLVRDGDHILATGLEHNAVARPLYLLQQQGRAEVTFLPCYPDGCFDPQTIRSAVRPNTRLFLMTHASNVLGNVLPVKEAFRIAREYGLYTVLDAAQTAGHIEVTLDEDTDLIAFTGHKGLRGVAGSGGFILNRSIAEKLAVWETGGTGSRSDSLDMPDFLPDRFEPGTPNTLGIIALGAAAAALQAENLEKIRSHEKRVTTRFVDGLKQLPVLTYGNYEEENWMPVVSMNILGFDAGVLARRLYEDFGIQTRSGLQCAPLAHQSIGTFPHGTVRFSFGYDTTEQEIDYVLEALAKLASDRR